MGLPQDWRTEYYKGMNVSVTALPHGKKTGLWDYTVRIAQPGEDTGAESELSAEAGDDADYPTPEAAIEAGFVKGYQLVDGMVN